MHGDGLHGWKEAAPYDAIHAGVSVPTVPEPLIAQLRIEGRLILPVGKIGKVQVLRVIDKDCDGLLRESNACNVAYVPLTSRALQLENFAHDR